MTTVFADCGQSAVAAYGPVPLPPQDKVPEASPKQLHLTMVYILTEHPLLGRQNMADLPRVQKLAELMLVSLVAAAQLASRNKQRLLTHCPYSWIEASPALVGTYDCCCSASRSASRAAETSLHVLAERGRGHITGREEATDTCCFCCRRGMLGLIGSTSLGHHMGRGKMLHRLAGQVQ